MKKKINNSQQIREYINKQIIHNGFRSCFDERYSCLTCGFLRCSPNKENPKAVACIHAPLIPILTSNYKSKTCHNHRNIIIKESKNIDSINP